MDIATDCTAIFKFWSPLIHRHPQLPKCQTMNRGFGLAGIHKDDETKQQLRILGDALAAEQYEELKRNLATFKENLESFAEKRAPEIKKNPSLRQHFQKMCSLVGVDPLRSSKGFWADLLGVGDFYYELSVQVVDICFRTRNANGGLISMEELLSKLKLLRSKDVEVTEDDVVRAVKQLEPLGGGFAIIRIPGEDQGKKKTRVFVQSLPHEMGTDLVKVIQISEKYSNSVTLELLLENPLHCFSRERAGLVLGSLVQEGVFWVDSQSVPVSYYLASPLEV